VSRAGPSNLRVTSAGVAAPCRAGIRRRLLLWYDHNKRDLPWRRRAQDAYAQWVAEIMLQQTRVETVLDYYEPFLRRFPTVKALADADLQDVLKLWEGLGYYHRALNLHRAARRLRDEARCVPRTAAELRSLPGVGAYTAAAIASIAFQQTEAAVDGNVARVLTRLFGIDHNVQSAETKTRLGNVADALLPRDRPGDFNQAWMDLGSLICTPKTPKCSRCPLRTLCVAAATGRVDTLPTRAGADRSLPEVSWVVGVFVHGGRMLTQRRPDGGLWSGLWEFPGFEERVRPRRLRGLRRLAACHSLTIVGRPKRTALVRHQLTHRAFYFHVYVSRVKPTRDGSKGPSSRWVSMRAFGKLAVSTAHRRVFIAAQPTILALFDGRNAAEGSRRRDQSQRPHLHPHHR